MIARRNNLRDHAILKRARKKQDDTPGGHPEGPTEPPPPPTKVVTVTSTSSSRKRRPASTVSDGQVAKEMDVAAVEATRSYRAWMALPDGAEFVYNQKYFKGGPNQDWLLRKNIWRRMRYRRENKKLVTKLREDDPAVSVPRKPPTQPTASEIVDQALSPVIKQEEASAPSPQPAAAEVGAPPPDAPIPLTEQQHVAGSKRALEDEEIMDSGKPQAKLPRLDQPDLHPAAAASAFPTVQNPVPAQDVTSPLPISEEASELSLPHTHQPPAPGPPTALMDDEHHPHHHHHHPPPLSATASTDDETAHAALTAAAAATASGAADDLVELSAVEAAVAAAANYVATHQNDDDDEGHHHSLEPEHHHHHQPHHHHHHPTSVHNPLEAAANADALESAAKLAAAAAAQEAQQVSDEHHSDALGLALPEDVVTAV